MNSPLLRRHYQPLHRLQQRRQVLHNLRNPTTALPHNPSQSPRPPRASAAPHPKQLQNAAGEVVAQHVVLPLHIGAFPACTAAVIAAFRDDIAAGDAFIINHPYHGGSPHAPDVRSSRRSSSGASSSASAARSRTRATIGGPVPGSCSGQAREIFNEGLHLPAVRYQRGFRANGDIERLIGANSRTPELVLGDIRGQLGADRLGEKRLTELVPSSARRRSSPASHACSRCRRESSRRRSRNGGRALRGRALRRRRRHRPRKAGADPRRGREDRRRAASRFSASAGETKGPANIRPPLVQAACAYALISMIDPGMYVSSGLLKGFTITAREGKRAQSALPRAGQYLQPDHPCAGRCHLRRHEPHRSGEGARRRQRQPLDHSRRPRGTNTGRGYVQYEIIAGGAGARASKEACRASR